MYGIPTAEIRRICRVSAATARRYKAGAAPAWAEDLVALVARGELARISPAWSGWRLAPGELVSPEGEIFRPGEIRAAKIHQARLAELERKHAGPIQFLLDV